MLPIHCADLVIPVKSNRRSRSSHACIELLGSARPRGHPSQLLWQFALTQSLVRLPRRKVSSQAIDKTGIQWLPAQQSPPERRLEGACEHESILKRVAGRTQRNLVGGNIGQQT